MQYGAAQPIVDLAQKAVNGAEKAINSVPSYDFRKIDPSWHDSMLKKANESFQPKVVAKKPVNRAQKRTAPLANKRVSRKKE